MVAVAVAVRVDVGVEVRVGVTVIVAVLDDTGVAVDVEIVVTAGVDVAVGVGSDGGKISLLTNVSTTPLKLVSKAPVVTGNWPERVRPVTKTDPVPGEANVSERPSSSTFPARRTS